MDKVRRIGLKAITVISQLNPISYLWRDIFSDTVAAGAVNGTAATPGVGNRIAVDAESKMSIADGNLVITGGKATPAYGDPGYWFPTALVRAAGRVVSFRFKVTTKNTFLIGFDVNTAGLLSAGLQFNSGLSIFAFFSGNAPVIGTYTENEWYIATIVFRASGLHFFLKGGTEYPTQTLVYSYVGDTTTPYYATICNNNAALVVDYVQPPETLWLPVPLASDAFTRADGALGTTGGNAHGDITGIGAGGSGLTWVDKLGTYTVATNKAQASALDGAGMAISTVDTGEADVNLEVTIARTAGISGAVVRYVDADNYIWAGWDGTNWLLKKRVAGTETTVLTAAAVIGGGLLKVQIQGTAVRMYRDATQVGTGGTIADAVLQTSTLHGLYTTDLANTQDLFIVWGRQ